MERSEHMPVTKTAKRALRSSKRKQKVNLKLISQLEVALRMAKKSKTKVKIFNAISMVDKAAKKGIIHKNKASRIKSNLSKLLPKQKVTKKGKGFPKASKKKPSKK